MSVSAGTVVVRGRGRAVVTATGPRSAMGRVAALMSTGPTLTPLQRRLVGVGRALAAVAVVLCAVVLALGLWRGQPVELMVIAAISLVVAAVPESLPAVVTLALALGARRMAARHALIRRLPAVETLGSVTVLATDKTGTLTEGTMYAATLWTPQRDATLDGAGYTPTGQIREGDQVLAPSDTPDVTTLLTAAMLCNDATLRRGEATEDAWAAVGDPTEAALLAAGGKFGLDQADVTARSPRAAELPFDSNRKRMSTVHHLPDGRIRIVCKGAPEAVLQPTVLTTDAATIARAMARAEELARQGHRVLAVAQADRDTVAPDSDLEQGLGSTGPHRAHRPAPPLGLGDHRGVPGRRHHPGADHRRPPGNRPRDRRRTGHHPARRPRRRLPATARPRRSALGHRAGVRPRHPRTEARHHPGPP